MRPLLSTNTIGFNPRNERSEKAELYNIDHFLYVNRVPNHEILTRTPLRAVFYGLYSTFILNELSRAGFNSGYPRGRQGARAQY